jgi:hypothetical protein
LISLGTTPAKPNVLCNEGGCPSLVITHPAGVLLRSPPVNAKRPKKICSALLKAKVCVWLPNLNEPYCQSFEARI